MGKAAGTASWVWYAAAAVTYCGAAIVEKGLLNWFVGPMWLVAFIWFGPLVADRVRGLRSRHEDEPDEPGPDERDDTPVGQGQAE
jgi:hypothetical protein